MFIIVVGGGKVGYYLAKSLISSHHEVAIIEKDSSKCSQFVEDFAVMGAIRQYYKEQALNVLI